MAVVKIRNERIWGAARWVFDNLIDRVVARTPEGSSLRMYLSQAKASGLYYMSLEDLSETDRLCFCRHVNAVYQDLRQADEQVSSTREGFTALKQRIAELVRVIHEEGL
jgi:hypothetical protein